MKFNRIVILSAVAALIFSVLACSALSSTPTASNFYMASDEQGTNKTTTFSATDDFYVFFDVSNIKDGTVFESKWYALNVSGQDASTPFKTLDYTYASGVNTIYMQLSNSGPWPAGNYKVEIDMADTKVGELQFSVQ